MTTAAGEERNLKVLEELAERNRVRELKDRRQKSRHDELLKSRENGFDVHFSGANADRVQQKKVERFGWLVIKRMCSTRRPKIVPCFEALHYCVLQPKTMAGLSFPPLLEVHAACPDLGGVCPCAGWPLPPPIAQRSHPRFGRSALRVTLPLQTRKNVFIAGHFP